MSGGDDSYPGCRLTSVCGGSGGGPPAPTPIGKLCEADEPAPDSLGPSERDIVCGGATEEDVVFIANDDDLPIAPGPVGIARGGGRRISLRNEYGVRAGRALDHSPDPLCAVLRQVQPHGSRR